MRIGRLLFALSLASIAIAGVLQAAERNNYNVTILVSNEPGKAPVMDPKLVNGWGIAASATSPWWVSDNGSGWSTVYTGAGVKTSVEVLIPGGAPTGIVSYAGTQFLAAPGLPARFIWASEEGIISAWNKDLADPTQAQMKFSHEGSIYKGLAIHENTLYTTDFAACRVVTLDGTFTPFESAGGFTDPRIPNGYCPFGIQAIGSSIFVTYALKGGEDDIAGQGHGFVREFDDAGHLMARVANHGRLNSPWGVAAAPANFGRFSGCLLVGNFGDGTINAFCRDADDRAYHPRGTLRHRGHRVVIDGLWGIGFGNDHLSGPSNVLYFAAGPDDEMNGYFGKIEVASEE